MGQPWIDSRHGKRAIEVANQYWRGMNNESESEPEAWSAARWSTAAGWPAEARSRWPTAAGWPAEAWSRWPTAARWPVVGTDRTADSVNSFGSPAHLCGASLFSLA